MFHWRDNIFVERMDDKGTVRIRKFIYSPNFEAVDWQFQPTEFDLIITGTEWCSIISSVSQDGETTEKYYEAIGFHRPH